MNDIHSESHHVAKPSPVVFSGKPHGDEILVGSDHMVRQCGAAIGGNKEEARLIGKDVRFIRAEHLYRDVPSGSSVFGACCKERRLQAQPRTSRMFYSAEKEAPRSAV